MYDTRKITHGTEQVSMGQLGDTTGVKWSTGVQKFAPSVDQDTKVIYSDARTHMNLTNPKKQTIEIDNLQYSDDEMEQMGFKKVNGGFIDTGTYGSFDIQRLQTVQNEDGTKTKKLEVYYNATSTVYSESDDEDEDEINPKVYTRTLTVSGREFDGEISKVFTIVRTPENADVFDKNASQIMQPSDFAQ